jgi:hypothetical protein
MEFHQARAFYRVRGCRIYRRSIHATFDNDEAIAEQLNTLSYPITGATVKNTSLANGRRHRQITSAQVCEETFA